MSCKRIFLLTLRKLSNFLKVLKLIKSILENVVESTMISRLRDFMRMNPPIFLFTKEKAEFASYKLKDVAQVWYIQWKGNSPKSRVLLSGKNLMKLFLVSTFHVR
ncbi:hypothetical protein EJD97_019938 [Solanum chilense]|uniref:Uncharacterized protein n=1 Tax=Solanum chilense TaxID=4083 RepID=A0A6N2CEW2_SOLCI|nr:hypothetical protein EJD97_019938 [Solanum chilense]